MLYVGMYVFCFVLFVLFCFYLYKFILFHLKYIQKNEHDKYM